MSAGTKHYHGKTGLVPQGLSKQKELTRKSKQYVGETE
jgi:hypothetical protein